MAFHCRTRGPIAGQCCRQRSSWHWKNPSRITKLVCQQKTCTSFSLFLPSPFSFSLVCGEHSIFCCYFFFSLVLTRTFCYGFALYPGAGQTHRQRYVQVGERLQQTVGLLHKRQRTVQAGSSAQDHSRRALTAADHEPKQQRPPQPQPPRPNDRCRPRHCSKTPKLIIMYSTRLTTTRTMPVSTLCWTFISEDNYSYISLSFFSFLLLFLFLILLCTIFFPRAPIDQQIFIYYIDKYYVNY